MKYHEHLLGGSRCQYVLCTSWNVDVPKDKVAFSLTRCICYRYRLYKLYRYNMIYVSYICLPPQKSSRFLGRKTTNLEALKNLRCLAGLPILKDWMMIMDLGTKPTNSCLLVDVGIPDFLLVLLVLMGWLFFLFFFVGVWPWFGLFGQENVVVKHPTCKVMDEHGILVELEDPR